MKSVRKLKLRFWFVTVFLKKRQILVSVSKQSQHYNAYMAAFNVDTGPVFSSPVYSRSHIVIRLEKFETAES